MNDVCMYGRWIYADLVSCLTYMSSRLRERHENGVRDHSDMEDGDTLLLHQDKNELKQLSIDAFLDAPSFIQLHP